MHVSDNDIGWLEWMQPFCVLFVQHVIHLSLLSGKYKAADTLGAPESSSFF